MQPWLVASEYCLPALGLCKAVSENFGFARYDSLQAAALALSAAAGLTAISLVSHVLGANLPRLPQQVDT